MPGDVLLTLWSETLHALASHSRNDVLVDLQALFSHLAGEGR